LVLMFVAESHWLSIVFFWLYFVCRLLIECFGEEHQRDPWRAAVFSPLFHSHFWPCFRFLSLCALRLSSKLHPFVWMPGCGELPATVHITHLKVG
jgi:hypothetical protein